MITFGLASQCDIQSCFQDASGYLDNDDRWF
jgi:hypothetical protein